MANGPHVPAQLYQILSERLQVSDKEAAIELYYELLSSGYSVGEILNGLSHGRSKFGQGERATAEQPRSGLDVATTGIVSEIVVADDEPAGAAWVRRLDITDEAESRESRKPEAIRSAAPDALGLDDRERLRREDWPGSEALILGSAGADTSKGWDAATGSGDQERFRFD